MRIPLLILPLLALAALPAAAQPRDPITGAAANFFTLQPAGTPSLRPQAFGGESCNVAIAAVGPERVWWGRFAGGRYENGNKHSRERSHSADGCFPTRAACEGWMFALKSEWGDIPKFDECRLGWDPRAPVAPWWQTQWRPPSYYRQFDRRPW
jgi:hypothetical protein